MSILHILSHTKSPCDRQASAKGLNMLMLFSVLFTLYSPSAKFFLQNDASSKDVSSGLVHFRSFSVDLSNEVEENFCYIYFCLR